MRYLPIDRNLFIKNRKKFASQLPQNALAIFNSNDIMPTNADGTMPFKQNSDLFYLCGIDQEETVLAIYPDAKNNDMKEVLFIKETSDLILTWEGYKLSKKQAQDISGIETIVWTKELPLLDELIENCDSLFLNSNEHARKDNPVQTRDDRFRLATIEKFKGIQVEQSAPIMHNLRYIKSETEIALITHACSITEKAFRRILPFIRSGVMEYEIEAEITHEFLINKSRGHAYQPIIASGGDACILHYIDNNKACQDGDIILMDFGAEYANYNSDLTRSVPVNGKFSPRQKEVYNAVLHVMKEAKKLLVVGNTFQEYHTQVGQIMEGELIKLGLLDSQKVKNQDPKKPLYKKYFMHGTSHSLGLDVHDVDNREVPFAAGMVFTCEPGIYIREENLGVRIENDILITETGNEDLMASIPIEVEEIEALMNP